MAKVMDGQTPAMKQYMQIKNENPDCLVLFRMGDFYETFYEDAKLCAQALDITLTSRGMKNNAKIPLAGIPYHALDNYLPKLVRKGIKVAIVEQLEDPKKAVGVVRRGLVRIVTPGTIIEQHMLDDRKNNYIASIVLDRKAGLSLIDISTGDFMTTEIGIEDVSDEIARHSPAEIIVPYAHQFHKEIIALRKQGYVINEFEDRFYLTAQAKKTLLSHFRIATLDGFGLMDRNSSVSASGALLSYLNVTQKTDLSYINKIRYYSPSQHMILDHITLRNLEILKNIRDGSADNTLLSVLDKTCTAMGARMLRRWLSAPLAISQDIIRRNLAVSELCTKTLLRQRISQALTHISDIERLISKVSYGSANPRDLISLRSSLEQMPQIRNLLSEASSDILSSFSGLQTMDKLCDLISAAICPEPPVTIREGGFIAQGYDHGLDELRLIMTDGKGYIRDIEEKERQKTGIKSLKVGFNRVFGYFIEITRANSGMVPQDYIRKQTMANCERYITEELKVHEEKVLGAEEKINDLEYNIFQQVIREVAGYTSVIQESAARIAELDCLTSLAQVACENSYVMPKLSSKGGLLLESSRHPVIERLEQDFIPNDISMDDSLRFMIITGPNMAGKSTYMRQVALIVIMAHIGSFVPAQKAVIPLTDRIFTRVGAHDDLASGQSTFMVEMTEVALILNNATERSLVIMDEIGRGTSTFDGVAIAWSVAEHILQKIRCKTLFATHYHVLTKLEKHPGAKNFNIAVKEDKDNIIFLHKIVRGGTDRSYGIHVASLAGMPKDVVENARDIQFRLYEDDKMKERINVERKRTDDSRQVGTGSQGSSSQEEDVIELVKTEQKTLFDSF